MRYVTALFDAPQPAGMALHLLRELGFEDRDLILLPELPKSTAGGEAAPWTADSETTLEFESVALSAPVHAPIRADQARASAMQRLQRLGLPEPTASLAAEGLDRGALVLAARVPNLSAEAAAQVMETAGALPSERTVRLWSRQPELRYRWSELAAPELVTEAEVEALEGTAPVADSPEARSRIAEPSSSGSREGETDRTSGTKEVVDTGACLEGDAGPVDRVDPEPTGDTFDEGSADPDATETDADGMDSGAEADEPA